jgi:hypothetical protein
MVKLVFVIAFAGLFASTMIPTNVLSEEIVFLRSASDTQNEAKGDRGQGWLFRHAGKCFVSLPKHILIDPKFGRNDRYAQIVVPQSSGRKPIKADADRCAVFRDIDLALMRVSGIADLADCGRMFTSAPNIDKQLSDASDASLVRADEGGTTERRDLKIRALVGGDANHFIVTPVSHSNRLTTSMSGGHVKIADYLIGFLLDVSSAETGPDSGTATILRIDSAALHIGRIFDKPDQFDSVTIDDIDCFGSQTKKLVSSTAPEKLEKQVFDTKNRASSICGAQVTAWSTASLSSAFRPENLVGKGGEPGRWRAKMMGDETTVDIQLCGDETSTISKITIDTSACESEDNKGFDIEAILMNQAGSPISSLGASLQVRNGFPITIGGRGSAPLIGGALRLRFPLRSKIKSAVVCLGPLQVE